jgi:hypothetical protein
MKSGKMDEFMPVEKRKTQKIIQKITILSSEIIPNHHKATQVFKFDVFEFF